MNLKHNAQQVITKRAHLVTPALLTKYISYSGRRSSWPLQVTSPNSLRDDLYPHLIHDTVVLPLKFL